MKKFLIILALCLPVLIYGQKGIHFEQGLSWLEVLQKAKKENKNIFVDCYATWCGPCKEMDATVYPNEEVGKSVNDKFISVKVQMDQTSNDDQNTKSWYHDAEGFIKKYTIKGYPTFLFFSSEGKPLHKSLGYKNAAAFIALTNDALIPDRQYYSLLTDYKPGVLDTAEMKALAISYKTQGPELAEKIVLDYLNRIPATEKFSDDNLKFLSEFHSSQNIQIIAYEYLAGLNKDDWGQKKNTSFAVFFCNNNNLKVQDLCVNYIKGLSYKEFVKRQNSDSNNLKFTIALASIPAVDTILADYLNSLSKAQFVKLMQIKSMNEVIDKANKYPAIHNIIVRYLENIDSDELNLKSNIELAIACQKDAKFKDFINQHYINKLRESVLTNKSVIELIVAFTTSVNDAGFLLLYNNQALIDSLMTAIEVGQSKYYAKDVANRVVNDIVATEINIKEYSTTVLKMDDLSLSSIEMMFKDYESKIKEKYPKADATQTVLTYKRRLFNALASQGRVSDEYAFKFDIEYINKFGSPLGDVGINLVSWDIFERSTETSQLNAAIKWMEKVVERNRNTGTNDELMYFDTYANLLYKVGRIQEAMAIEPKIFKGTYDKMVKGLPTWPEAKSKSKKTN